jgi:hypothetical protein
MLGGWFVVAALFWIVVAVATFATTFDAIRFSREEYVAAFGRTNLRVFFVGAPLFVLVCGAGIAAPFVYYLWGRRRLESARQHGGRQAAGLGSVDDSEWPGGSSSPTRTLAEAEQRYESLVSGFYGSPESLTGGGQQQVAAGDIATALFFFQKAIDLLHTQYCFNGMQQRTPGDRDTKITDAYLSALRRVREQWSQAAVDGTVAEVTHRLRTISTACREAGLDPHRYLRALTELEQIAPDVDVSRIFWKNPSA